MSQEIYVCDSNQEQTNNTNQDLQLNQNTINELIIQSKKKFENQLSSCINEQINVLADIFYYIVEGNKKINAWENLICEIVQTTKTHQENLQSLQNQRIDSSVVEKSRSNIFEDIKRFDQIIAKGDLEKYRQKKSRSEKLLLSLKNQLKDLKQELKSREANLDEYFIKDLEEQQELNKELTYEQKKILKSGLICLDDLCQEFGVSDYNDDPQDNINQDEFYNLIKQGLIKLKILYCEEAQELFEKAISMNPYNSKAHHCLAISLSFQDDQEQANSCYEKAIELDPNYESCYLNYVRNRYQMDIKNNYPADNLLKQIKERFPNCKVIHYLEELQKLKKNKQKLNQDDIFN